MNREIVIRNIPSSYNYFIHILIPSLLGIGIIIISSLFISNLSFGMIPAVIITLFFSFGFEWYAHKNILHKPFPFLEFVNQRHIEHHLVYTDQDMAIRSGKELYLVLMPTYAILAVLGFISPIILIIYLIFGEIIASTVLISMIFFFLSYEWLHFSYHLPENSFIGRIQFIKFMRKHHQQHHIPLFMLKYNFNVTVPVFDWILKTKK